MCATLTLTRAWGGDGVCRDTLVWFAVLMSMCSALAAGGLVDHMAQAVGSALAELQLPWLSSFALLHAVFFWSHCESAALKQTLNEEGAWDCVTRGPQPPREVRALRSNRRAVALALACMHVRADVFASQVGHVGALYGAFLAMMLAAGVPSTLGALTLGYSANLFGSLTHYASGPAAVFHGSGYTRLSEVMKAGFLMALRSWAVWGVVGMAWWRVLGWW